MPKATDPISPFSSTSRATQDQEVLAKHHEIWNALPTHLTIEERDTRARIEVTRWGLYHYNCGPFKKSLHSYEDSHEGSYLWRRVVLELEATGPFDLSVWYDIAAQLQIGRVFKESLQLTKHHPTDLTSFETFPRSEMRAFKHLYVQHNRKWYAALDNAVGDTEEDRIRAARKALIHDLLHDPFNPDPQFETWLSIAFDESLQPWASYVDKASKLDLDEWDSIGPILVTIYQDWYDAEDLLAIAKLESTVVNHAVPSAANPALESTTNPALEPFTDAATEPTTESLPEPTAELDAPPTPRPATLLSVLALFYPQSA